MKLVTIDKSKEAETSKIAIIILMYAIIAAEDINEAKEEGEYHFFDGAGSAMGNYYLELFPDNFKYQSNPQYPTQVTAMWTTKLELIKSKKVIEYKLGKGNAKYLKLESSTKATFKKWLKAEYKKGIEGFDLLTYMKEVKALLQADSEVERGSKSSENFEKVMLDMGF